jgi:hypothetical protein
MVAASAIPAVADIEDFDQNSILDDNDSNDDDNDSFEDDDGDEEDNGDEIANVDVGEAFFDSGEVCVPVVIEFEDGSTDVDEQCEDVDLEDVSFSV